MTRSPPSPYKSTESFRGGDHRTSNWLPTFCTVLSMLSSASSDGAIGGSADVMGVASKVCVKFE